METPKKIVNLIEHGNSYAVVIESPILEVLGVSSTTAFEIVTDGQCLVLIPMRDNATEPEFQKALEMVHKRFGSAMKRLAE